MDRERHHELKSIWLVRLYNELILKAFAFTKTNTLKPSVYLF